MKIILLGPPGSGKGTQAKRLEARHGLVQVSTGEILREAVASESLLGKTIKNTMAAGNLISDDLVLEVLERRLAEPDCKDGVVFDGFPRTIAQAEALNDIFSEAERAVDAVIMLEVDDVVLISRIEQRAKEAVDGKVRSDDRVEVLKNRLSAYYEWTAPIIPFYEARGLLWRVDGMREVHQVTDAIETIVSQI
ncbi:MAG: adenylate kinase [Rhodospirillaceae bacterium]|nr:adenylate kinase [Rhodospirillaceae bacterium]MBE90226.1 adenylate kinase [Rhodospirillaceae bacterium]